MKTRDYSNVPECDVLDSYIMGRLRKGLHTHILITGLQGRGKSDFGIRLGERISAAIPDATPFSHLDIVDSLVKLIRRIRAIKRPGEIIMIEEVSVLFPSKRAMSHDNVAVGRILDTIRKKQCILISNAPLFTSIDSHMRALAEVLVQCERIIKGYKLVQAKAWILQTNPHTGKTYRHRFRRQNGIPIIFHYAKKSNKDIRDKYEVEKERFIDELLEKLEQRSEDKTDKEEGKTMWIQDEIYRMMTDERMVPQDVAKKLKISVRMVYKHVEKLTNIGKNPRIYLEKLENDQKNIISAGQQLNSG